MPYLGITDIRDAPACGLVPAEDPGARRPVTRLQQRPAGLEHHAVTELLPVAAAEQLVELLRAP